MQATPPLTDHACTCMRNRYTYAYMHDMYTHITVSCMHPGGFEWYVDPVPDLELWSRWTAAGAVSGLMHEQGGGKGTGKKSHIFDFPGGTAIWRKFAKFRTQLFPYIYTQAHIAHQVKKKEA